MKPRALVVDDSLTVRMDLMDGLRAAGFDPIGSSSVADARERLADTDFDIVILDVRLGDGSGVDLLCEIRQRAGARARTPVMMLSSEAEVRDRIRGLSVGADEYAGKPYVLSYVIARANELVNARRSEPLAADKRPTVLVIDDSLSFREAIRDALEEAGYAALVAETGEEGLRVAAAVRPRLVIVDGHLPGIDGATVIRRLRLDAALRRTPCIMITASDAPGREINAFEAGVDAFLGKGTAPAEVVARVASLLASSPETPGAPVRSALGANKLLVVGAVPAGTIDGFRAEGFEVTSASSVDDALALLAVETPASVLVEVSSPKVCRTIRRALRNPSAILALTGDDDSRVAIDCLAAGADEVVLRTTPSPLLVARVRAQLRRKQADEEALRERHERLTRELMMSETRAAQALAEARAAYLSELEQKNAELALSNNELEAFSYSVSHDLRAPLRAISGFSHALEEDFADKLGEDGRQHVARIVTATKRMNELIEDLLTLSRVTRAELQKKPVDLTQLAQIVARDVRGRMPERAGEIRVAEGLEALGDPSLLRAVLENLIGNAWKFTSKRPFAEVEVGVTTVDGERAFFVKDNGVGFDMQRVDKLFRPFQRLHTVQEFEGTGIGLATVRRIIVRHGGRAWAEASPTGACIFFTVASS